MSITEALAKIEELVEFITTDEDIRLTGSLHDALEEASQAIGVLEAYVAEKEGQGGLDL